MLEWISAESWQAFIEMRRRIRAPLTPYAEKLIHRELVRLKSLGHDPQACLDQSIMLAWRDVFPVRERCAGMVGRGTGEVERLRERAAQPETPEQRVAAQEALRRAREAVRAAR
jgi:hypothetical protein